MRKEWNESTHEEIKNEGKNLFIRKNRQTSLYIWKIHSGVEGKSRGKKELLYNLLLLRKLRSAVIIKITGVDKVENSQI